MKLSPEVQEMIREEVRRQLESVAPHLFAKTSEEVSPMELLEIQRMAQESTRRKRRIV